MNKGFWLNYINSNKETVVFLINRYTFIDYEIIGDNISISFGKDCIIKREETFYKWKFSVNVMQIINFKELIEFLKQVINERKKLKRSINQ